MADLHGARSPKHGATRSASTGNDHWRAGAVGISAGSGPLEPLCWRADGRAAKPAPPEVTAMLRLWLLLVALALLGWLAFAVPMSHGSRVIVVAALAIVGVYVIVRLARMFGVAF